MMGYKYLLVKIGIKVKYRTAKSAWDTPVSRMDNALQALTKDTLNSNQDVYLDAVTECKKIELILRMQI